MPFRNQDNKHKEIHNKKGARHRHFNIARFNNFYSLFVTFLGSWQNINANPLCFGAKDNSFGTFAIHKPGDIYRLKLVHHSGYVNCISDSASATKWGCSASAFAKKVNVHITDENNNRVFPTARSVRFDHYYFYELPGFDENSAEIVLDFFPAPLSVAAGQKFRIWYGEDLMKRGEGNNIGKSCVDVYGFY